MNCILFPVSSDRENVWVIYFTPEIYWEKVDGILSSLYFERTRIPSDLKGTPAEALALLEEKIAFLEQQLENIEKDLDTFIAKNTYKAIDIFNSFQKLNCICEIKIRCPN